MIPTVAGPDPRLWPPEWRPVPSSRRALRRSIRRARLVRMAGIPLAAWYFGWLLWPGHIGNPVLYAVLVLAEMFNLGQALGFWWTVAHDWVRPEERQPGSRTARADVDVLIPVFDEPIDVVEPSVAAARSMRGARVRILLLDDGHRDELEAMAARHGATYVRRANRTGAKAGNLNHALGRSRAPFVAVFDCDHVPHETFLERTLGHFTDPRVAFVQTPQYYANRESGGKITMSAWAQQALFFGPIARGKDAMGAMFCCGTNFVIRRRALEGAGGFPERSLTEDFELSIRLHEKGWRSVYVPEVLASGLGPEDMRSYVGQQRRWSRGCLAALPSVLRSRLPRRLRLQYLLSVMYFLSGWTALVYMSLPVIRILTGAQPLASASADQFVLYFAPYFGMALLAVALAGDGQYTFSAFALSFANFWIHIGSTFGSLLRVGGRFVVTPKRGRRTRQPFAVMPALLAVACLVGVGVDGLMHAPNAATVNNVAFATLHVCVLLTGAWPALEGRPAQNIPVRAEVERSAA